MRPLHSLNTRRRSILVLSVALTMLSTLWALARSPRDVMDAPAPQRYIVRLHSPAVSAAASSQELAQTYGLRLGRTYEHAFVGFSTSMPAASAEALRRHPLVVSVEADQLVSVEAHAVQGTAQGMQTDAPWGLDRIDQRALPLDATYRFVRSGQGVRVYVVDTGILAAHVDLAGRVLAGHDLVGDGRATTDCNGHGTHVAGTIGGARWGVAKDVTLVPVRVLDCSGRGLLSTVLAGLDRVAAEADGPAVVNLSVSSSRSDAFNAAVAALDARGLTVVAAAGNNAGDACQMSPASEPSALTVGASTALDEHAAFSNRGPCVDLYAPGSGIASAWHTAADAATILSGTSMAAPHVSGAAALALAANPSATPGQVRRHLAEQATGDVVRDPIAGATASLLYALTADAPAARRVGVRALTAEAALAQPGGRLRPQVAATVLAYEDGGWAGPVAGATVRGVFEPGGLAACTTDARGVCTIEACDLGRLEASGRFTVLQISGDGLVDDAALGQREVALAR
jgi:subtilisin family serine protease